MQPALTHLQNDVRTAELRSHAERQRSLRSHRRTTHDIETGPSAKRARAFGNLFLGHGFFGREHG